MHFLKEILPLTLVCAIAMTGGAFLYQSISGGQVVAAGPSPTPPETAPGFQLADVNGQMHNADEWEGSYQLLNFWATWCPPCRREIPLLNEMQKRYGDSGLQVIGIAIDQPNMVTEFTRNTELTYISLVGQLDATKVAEAYGNPVGALPYSVLIAPDGSIPFSHMGELEAAELEALLEAQLKP